MKINSELERILRAEQQAHPAVQKSTDSSAAFDNVLQTALQKPDANSEKGTFLPVTAYNADLLAMQQMQANAVQASAPQAVSQAEETYSVQALLSDIENSLSGLDAYTKSLHNLGTGSDLKQAWQNLSAFSQSVGSLRQNYAGLSQQDSSLDAMINDLEIMAVTETYKFNRGDYSL